MLRSFVWLVLALVAALAAGAPAGYTTCLRHAHEVLILAEKGKPFEVTLYAVSASLGYPDPLAFRLRSPRAKLVERGSVKPGETHTIRVVPEASGAYRLSGNPMRNAFAVTTRGATWLVEMRDGGIVELISRAAPLHFFVPAEAERVTVAGGGEAATLRLVDPTGEVVSEASYPNYQKASVTAPVPAGLAGKTWQLHTKLSEDCMLEFCEGVLPYLSETPLTEEVLALLSGGPGTLTFDRQLAAREALFPEKASPAVAQVSTGAGLSLSLDAAGRVLPEAKGGGTGGFLVRDCGGDGDVFRLGLKVRKRGAGVALEGSDAERGLALKATLAPAKRGGVSCIRASGSLSDTTGADRAVTLTFALPAPAAGAEWWDDLDHSRPAEGRQEWMAGRGVAAGSAGFHSTYPWGCVTGERSAALAIPLDRPCLHRIGYNPSAQVLFVSFDFALTPATRKLPQRADFAFTIYPLEGTTEELSAWGFRAAAEGYYRLFPESFEGRVKEYGGWVCWDSLEKTESPKEIGFLYHWGPSGAEAVRWDDAHGVPSYLYNDSCRYFADIGQYPKRPDAAEVTRVFREYLGSANPAAFVKSRPDSATGKQRYQSLERQWGEEKARAYLERCVAAVRRSAAEDAEGNLLTGYLTDRKDWGPSNWWTGRLHCTIDPDLEGGYGRFLLDEIIFRTFEEVEREGARFDGVGLDNYFVNADFLDFRREHFASSDYPLTFATGDNRPVLLGDFSMFEWTAELRKRLGPKRAVIANLCVFPYPFAAHVLDIHGFEWNLARMAPLARALAYRKPLVTLPVADAHYEEPFLREHLRFGAVPGGYGGQRFNKPELRALYRRYVPTLLRMNRAGWSPLPYARADRPEVFIERFGPGPRGDLLYTVHNAGKEAGATTVTLDTARAGLKGRPAGVRDALTGEAVPSSGAAGALSLKLDLAPGETRVLAVGAG